MDAHWKPDILQNGVPNDDKMAPHACETKSCGNSKNYSLEIGILYPKPFTPKKAKILVFQIHKGKGTVFKPNRRKYEDLYLGLNGINWV